MVSYETITFIATRQRILAVPLIFTENNNMNLYSIQQTIDKLLELNIICPNNKQLINPNAERMLLKRERFDLIESINYHTDFIFDLKESKLKDKIRVMYRDRFESINDVPICKNCSNQVLVLCGPYKKLGEFCSINCSNFYKNKMNTIIVDEETGLPVSKLIAIKRAFTLNNTIDEETGLTLRKLINLNVSKGRLKIDSKTGKTIAKIAMQKEAIRRRNTIDEETGLSLEQLYGKKTYENNLKNGHFKRVGKLLKEFYKTEKGKECKKRTAIKQRRTLLGLNSTKNLYSLGERDRYKIYKRRVRYYTSKNCIHLKNYEKRANHYNDKNAYHVDHKFSISHGFENNIPPYIIGSFYNLQMLPWKQNLEKSTNCSITIEELLEKVFGDNCES